MAQEDGEQASSDRETDALGVDNCSEFLLLVAREPSTLSKLSADDVKLATESVEVATVARAIDGPSCVVGFAVETLTRNAAVPGMTNDRAMLAEEDGGSAGQGFGGRLRENPS